MKIRNVSETNLHIKTKTNLWALKMSWPLYIQFRNCLFTTLDFLQDFLLEKFCISKNLNSITFRNFIPRGEIIGILFLKLQTSFQISKQNCKRHLQFFTHQNNFLRHQKLK
jgi:hypothetical protein